nr:transcriptional regulator [Escherichia coli]
MKAYWDSLTKEQQGELAGKVGSTPGYLRLVFNGYKKASFVLAQLPAYC